MAGTILRRSHRARGAFRAAACLALTALVLPTGRTAAQTQKVEIKIGHLRLAEPPILPISLIERPAPDNGLAGAQLGIEDNNTTGQFTNQKYTVSEAAVTSQQQALEALAEFAAGGIRFVVADLPAEMLLAVADQAAASEMLVFNAGATDDELRMENCRANVIHIAPSRAMLADALAQFLVWKKWTRWF